MDTLVCNVQNLNSPLSLGLVTNKESLKETMMIFVYRVYYAGPKIEPWRKPHEFCLTYMRKAKTAYLEVSLEFMMISGVEVFYQTIVLMKFYKLNIHRFLKNSQDK